MEKINGVEITVFLNEEPVEIQDDSGCLGNLDQGMLKMVVHVLPGTNIHAATTDGSFNVNLMKDYAKKSRNPKPPSTGKVFIKRMPMTESEEGHLYVQQPQNNINLFLIFRNGIVIMWRVSIVSQHGCFYLAVQEPYSFPIQCYKNDTGTITCPCFEGCPKKWPQLVKVFKELFAEIDTYMESVSNFKPAPEITAGGLSANQGRVMFWDCSRGWGMIATPEGNARVHWEEIRNMDNQLRRLNVGELVSYECLVPPAKTTNHRAGVKFDALGVNVL